MTHRETLEGYWHARAKAERERAEHLERTVQSLNESVFALESKILRGKVEFRAPVYVAGLLRDLAALGQDPKAFSEVERESLTRVARTTADMLDQHRWTQDP